MTPQRKIRRQFLASLGLATLVSTALLGLDALHDHRLAYGYLLWNLFLAWVPFGLSLWLARVLRYKLWSSWSALALSLLWLGFLPNSFYMVSDFIHLQESVPSEVLYDAVMFASFIFTGVALGMSSLYLVHLELRKRFHAAQAGLMIALVLLACSFAVYIGRDLRWNTWDVLLNPAALLFDVSERFLRPAEYPGMLLTTASFFVLFGSIYQVIWRSIRLLKAEGERALL